MTISNLIEKPLWLPDRYNLRTSLKALWIGLSLIMVDALYGMWPAHIAYSALIAAFSLTSPITGTALWLLYTPFEIVSVTNSGFSPYILVTPAFLGGSFLHCIWYKNFRLPTSVILVAVCFLAAATLSVIFGGPASDPRPLISVLLLTACTVLGISAVSNDPETARLILFSALMSALGAALYALIQYDGGWRLTMTAETGAGVRAIDTSASMALAILMCLSVSSSGARSAALHPLPAARVQMFLFCGLTASALTLFATVSRGAILAVTLASMIVAVSFAIKALYLGEVPKRAGFTLLAAIFFALIVPAMDFLISEGQLWNRIERAIAEPGSNPRWQIWGDAINSLHGWDWIIGAGLGSFRTLGGASPHGAYFGIFVEMGAVGALLALLAFLMAGVSGVRRNGIPFLMIFAFTVLSFLTKGSLYNKWLYFYLVISHALSISLVQKYQDNVI